MPDIYEVLPWDSSFFGFVVAKILPNELDDATLRECLDDLRSNGASLVYWSCDPCDIPSQKAALSAGGLLADKKVTYVKTMLPSRIDSHGYDHGICEYTRDAASHELENLAIQAGVYSRFNIDPRIPREKFELMYRIWIRESVAKRIAAAVLVFSDDGEEKGMITISTKDSRGQVGLVAVDASVRGKRIGERLLRSAETWCRRNGYFVVQIVTQGQNRPACCMYEKNAYSIEKTESFYHFWM